jgi:uncharacterized membrane protein YhaH (DUF805 family)
VAIDAPDPPEERSEPANAEVVDDQPQTPLEQDQVKAGEEPPPEEPPILHVDLPSGDTDASPEPAPQPAEPPHADRTSYDPEPPAEDNGLDSVPPFVPDPVLDPKSSDREFPARRGAKAIARRLFLDFDFTGRTARPDYWRMFAIRAAVILVCLLLIVQGMGTGPDTGGAMYPGMDGGMYPPMDDSTASGASDDAWVGGLAGVVLIWIVLAGIGEAARRLHDTGKTGWWNLIALIPYVGFFVLLFLLAEEGKPGDNEYGPAPDAPTSPGGRMA